MFNVKCRAMEARIRHLETIVSALERIGTFEYGYIPTCQLWRYITKYVNEQIKKASEDADLPKKGGPMKTTSEKNVPLDENGNPISDKPIGMNDIKVTLKLDLDDQAIAKLEEIAKAAQALVDRIAAFTGHAIIR